MKLLIGDWGLVKKGVSQQEMEEAVKDERILDAFYLSGGAESKSNISDFSTADMRTGNTEPILDALKKHNAPAAFFVVGHYINTAPEIVKRMVDEGHIVGNHTYHHPDMSSIADTASFENELKLVSDSYKELIGNDMPKFYRPPQGKYNVTNLAMAKELGFKTFFWSLAYADWDQNNQPEPNAAIEKLTARIHPGAVVLLHNTSSTNAHIIDELLTRWEQMGYTFASLKELS